MKTEFLWTAYTINMLNNWSLQRLHNGLLRQTSTGETYKISKIKQCT